jgi:hypothetical protein
MSWNILGLDFIDERDAHDPEGESGLFDELYEEMGELDEDCPKLEGFEIEEGDLD